MNVLPKPIINSVFNPLDFQVTSTFDNLQYVNFPTAQGDVILPSATVNGISTVNGIITAYNSIITNLTATLGANLRTSVVINGVLTGTTFTASTSTINFSTLIANPILTGLKDKNASAGSNRQLLTSTGSQIAWSAPPFSNPALISTNIYTYNTKTLLPNEIYMNLNTLTNMTFPTGTVSVTIVVMGAGGNAGNSLAGVAGGAGGSGGCCYFSRIPINAGITFACNTTLDTTGSATFKSSLYFFNSTSTTPSNATSYPLIVTCFSGKSGSASTTTAGASGIGGATTLISSTFGGYAVSGTTGNSAVVNNTQSPTYNSIASSSLRSYSMGGYNSSITPATSVSAGSGCIAVYCYRD